MKVMKIINLIIGIACLLGACHSNRMRIEGEIGDIKENKIYLGEITNTYYGLFDPIDSAEIEEGKFYGRLCEKTNALSGIQARTRRNGICRGR